MRKISLTFALIVCALLINTDCSAQYKFFTGGQLMFNSASNNVSDAQTNTFAVLPYIGASVSENILVGLAIGYEGSTEKIDDQNSTKIGTFKVNPFARYRVSPSDKMGLYGELGVNVNFLNATTETAGVEGDSKGTGFGVYLGPGIDYALADRWVVNALWGALSFDTTSNKDSDFKSNGFGLNLNPGSIRFSLNFLF